jgi:hypothetical protein
MDDDERGERLGYTKWNDVTSIVGLLAEAYPSLAAEAKPAARKGSGSKAKGTVSVSGYTRRFPTR